MKFEISNNALTYLKNNNIYELTIDIKVIGSG